jgi:hypothetical protein
LFFLLQWQATLQAIDWWERAASEASLSGAFDGEVSLLHNATIMANALAQPPPTGSFTARPVLVPDWRRARWERCAAAALLLAAEVDKDVEEQIQSIHIAGASSALRLKGVALHGGQGGDSRAAQKASLVHCLRALHLLHVPMPWSEEYQKAIDKALIVEKASKVVKFLTKLAQKVTRCASGDSTGVKIRNSDASLGALPDSTGLIRATLAGDFATLAKLEPEKDDGFSTEQIEPLIDVAMLAAVMTTSPEWQQNYSNFKYVLWVCEYLAGGPHRIDHGSALYMVRDHARLALRRAKGCGGSGMSARGGGGGDNDGGDGQQLRSLKEMFSLQRIHGRATK